MNLSVSRKRLLDVSSFSNHSNDIENNNEPSFKKQKLEYNTPKTAISSIWFVNSSDHEQFVQIFKIIDNSELIKSLNITHCINKEISEYATGSFVKCNQCNNSISILFEDKAIYNNDHNNANKLGYKYCMYSNKYFCSECMDKVQKNDKCDCECSQCMELRYIPECDTCFDCDSLIFHYDVECDCNECNGSRCNYCDYIACSECGGIDICTSCDNWCCINCEANPDDWTNADYCVCIKCYDDTIIECNKCNGKWPVFYKGNGYLGPINNGWDDQYEMIMCSYPDCDCFVCFKCDEQHRNGKYMQCQKNECDDKAVYCNQHIPRPKTTKEMYLELVIKYK